MTLNLCLLKTESSSYSQDFLLALRNNSAFLIDNIFVNNPDQVLISGNIIIDVCDHFSQNLSRKELKNATSLNFPLRNLMICPRLTKMILLPQKQITLMTCAHLSTEN